MLAARSPSVLRDVSNASPLRSPKPKAAAKPAPQAAHEATEEELRLVAHWMDVEEDDDDVVGICDECDAAPGVVDVCALCGREFCASCWDRRADADAAHGCEHFCSQCVLTHFSGGIVLKL